jgi:hypothetical protein
MQYNRGLAGFLKSLFMRRKYENGIPELEEQQKLLDAVKEAKMELESIQAYFNCVSDPDLIEYAIYQEYAMRLKCSYLVKLAKQKNIKSLNFTVV